MSRRRGYRKGKSRKKLAYGVIVVAFILICFLAYFYLYQSNQPSGDHATPPQAAIVDHLSFTGQPNQTFVNACINILEEGGLTWAYHRGEEVTVDFYRDLPSCGTRLIILRVHSAIMRVNDTTTIDILGLFTSERYYGPVDAHKKYPEDVEDIRLVEAFFSPEEREQGISYFGIVPRFVEKSMKGEFENAIIIMMGCEGLGYNGQTYTAMAKAFVNKGAKVYISWDGPVGVNHTDQATLHLLQSLILEKQTIKKAVEEIGPDPEYHSKLGFYPDGVGNYRITNLASGLTSSIIETGTICIKPWHLRVRHFQKLQSLCWGLA
jgi:hypothetical protein